MCYELVNKCVFRNFLIKYKFVVYLGNFVKIVVLLKIWKNLEGVLYII